MSAATQDRTAVFVYGTLMRGESRHHALRDQLFVSTAQTEPRYRLYLIGDYPGLVDAKDGDGVSVHGEIWSVDQQNLLELDAIECVDDDLYQRRKIRLVGSLGPVDAWFYLPVDAWFYLPDVRGRIDLGTDWRSR